MEENKEKKSGSFLNIPEFWMKQRKAWRITVYRTSMERLAYKMILPYLSLFIILLGATKTQYGYITSAGLIVGGIMGPFVGQSIDRFGPKKVYLIGIYILIGGYLALSAAKKTNKTVAFFSLEMSREQLAMRLLSGESFVDSQKMATGKLSEDEWEKLGMASVALSQTEIRVDDNPSITVAEMNAKLRRVENLGLVIIDYLQLMTGSGYGKSSENRVQVVGEISRSLKIMAKELNVPVICLSQLSRAVESRQDKRPIMSDLRESGAIEQDADAILFLYRDDYYNPNSEEKNVAECIVSKNRHGETGTVKLQWLPQYTTFADREWKHAE